MGGHPEDVLRGVLEAALVTASWVDEARALTGITGVSQVWGGRPEWYLWLDRAPGAYALRVEEADTLAQGSTPLVQGLLSLKCYPAREHPLAALFSEDERGLLSGPFFDETGTPCYEKRGEIPHGSFTVGALTLLLDPMGGGALLGFESLTTLRTLRSMEGEMNPGGPDGPVHPQIVRRVPGWAMGYPLFDLLVSLLAHYRREPPRRIRLTRSPGYEQVVHRGGVLARRETPEIALYSIWALFADPCRGEGAGDLLGSLSLESGEEVLLETEGSLPEGVPVPETSRSLNPLWWRLAGTPQKSGLGSTCGCGHAHGPGPPLHLPSWGHAG